MIDHDRIRADNDRQYADKLAELRGEHRRLLDEADSIAAKYPNPTAGQKGRIDNLMAGARKVADQISEVAAERDARLDTCISIAEAAQNPARLEPAVGPLYGDTDWQPMRRTGNPWTEDARQRFGSDHVRGRAFAAIDRSAASDTAKTITETLICDEQNGSLAARWATATTDPDYRQAFRSYLTRPETAALDYTAKQNQAVSEASQVRAALAIGSGDSGGYLMPFELDPTIVLTNTGVTNPIRNVARTVQTTTNVWHGVSSAGVTAEWLAEAAEAADASPTFAQPTVQIHRASAYVQASLEAAADTTIPEQLTQLFIDAKDRLEAAAFATGTGSGQPYGIVTRVAAVTTSRVSATTNNTFGSVDVYKTANALPPRHRPNATWLAEQTTLNSIRQFDTSGGSAFWANLGAGTPEQLLGKPIFECSLMDTVATGDDDVLLLGDLSNFLVADRVGMSVLYDPLVRGQNRRPTGEVGWFCYWRVGADVVGTTDAVRLLRV